MKYDPIATREARPVLASDTAAAVKGCLGCEGCKGLCAALLEIMTVPDVVTRRAGQ